MTFTEMITHVLPWLVGLLALATVIGRWQIVKLITVQEARHELREGSAGWLRSISGWSAIAFWVLSTWFCATILGDWAVSGDLDAAMARAALRLRILLEFAAAIAESD